MIQKRWAQQGGQTREGARIRHLAGAYEADENEDDLLVRCWLRIECGGESVVAARHESVGVQSVVVADPIEERETPTSASRVRARKRSTSPLTHSSDNTMSNDGGRLMDIPLWLRFFEIMRCESHQVRIAHGQVADNDSNGRPLRLRGVVPRNSSQGSQLGELHV